jgi:CBS domain-containing protein
MNPSKDLLSIGMFANMTRLSLKALRRIPVVGQNMKLIGIISQADVATRLGEPGKTGEVVKEISQQDT